MKRLIFAGFGACVALACSSSDSNPSTQPGTDASVDAPANDSATDGGASSDEYRSGTRLRAKLWTSADGAKVFHGFYDTMLKTDCTVGLADDSSLRCLPLPAPATLLFTDASCKSPVGVTTKGCTPPAFVEQSVGFCAVSVYPSKGTLSSATSFYYQGSTCSAYGNKVDVAFDVGPKLDPSAFVKATRVREARGSALMLEVFDMEDGARMPIGAWDVARKSQCDSSTLSTLPGVAAGRCIPTHVAYAEGQFADSSCTKQAAYVPDNACDYAPDDALVSAWVYGKGSCQSDGFVGFATVSTSLTMSAYQKTGNGMCQPANIPNASFAPVTGDLPVASLPELAPAPEGSGRLVRYTERAGTGEKVLAQSFWDTMLSVECRPAKGADGKLRCAPTGQGVQWYADSSCKQPVFAATDPMMGCPNNTPPAYLQTSVSDGATCPSYSLATYKVGAKIASQASVYSLNGGMCQENTGAATWVLYGTTAVAPSSLAEVTDVTE